MTETLRIFVSATNDLDAERAAIGQLFAQLPAKIGAEIRRTPAVGASYDDIFELIANCDRVYFLFGSDITAPFGAEWFTAWKLERSIYPLRKSVRLTPAAREFTRSALVEWTAFRTTAELARMVTLDLVRILSQPTNRYGFTLPELELLKLHEQRIRKAVPHTSAELGGTEGGAVLLDSMQRDVDEELLLGEE